MIRTSKQSLLLPLLLVLPFLNIAPVASSADAPPTDRESLETWREMRFGMFIHWGPVSLKGTEIGWSRGREVPREEYDSLYKRFNPEKFSAKEWVSIAKETGMKYMVLTSKHHDGFSLWDSEYTTYDIMSTPFGRDVIEELSEECKRQGILFCLYYSILDWHHEDYLPQSHGGPHDGRPPEQADFERYVQYMKNQLSELETKYGPLGIFWFDGEWESTWSKERGWDLYKYCRNLRSDALVNNRVGKGRAGMQGMWDAGQFAGDYGTPEQEIGAFNNLTPWETCMTLCQQWAWKPKDKMKSLKQCIQTLVTVAGGDGNFLFNVGPMPDGRIEPRQVERLRAMGHWMQKYGKTLYGTRGGPFKPGPWGVSTNKGNRIFVHILKCDDGTVTLPPIDATIQTAKVLTGSKIDVKQTDEGIRLELPKANIDPIDTIVELRIDRPAGEIAPVD